MECFRYGTFCLYSVPMILHYKDKTSVDVFHGFVLMGSKTLDVNDYKLIAIFDSFGDEICPSDFQFEKQGIKLEIALSISKKKIPLEFKLECVPENMIFSVRNHLLTHYDLRELLKVMEGRKSIVPSSITIGNFGILGFTMLDPIVDEDGDALFFDSFGYSLGDEYFDNLNIEFWVRSNYKAKLGETLVEQIENFNRELLDVTSTGT